MSTSDNRSRRVKALALLGGGVAAGVVGAFTLGATAQTATSGTGSTSTSTPSAPHGNGEVAVTGTKAATLKAAALAKYPGATVESITTETDSTGAAYEVHLTKADGTRVAVLFDANLSYVSTETDAGHHGHGGGGSGESVVTGTKATTLKAAALAKVPGATVDTISTDSGDAAYEVHMTKTDGSRVTVKFDSNLKFVAVEDGMGK